jgi:hypothetical protein
MAVFAQKEGESDRESRLGEEIAGFEKKRRFLQNR